MNFIYELYKNLMWTYKKDEMGNTYKEPYMTLNDIDNMDIFFYLDMKIYELNKDKKDITKRYDAMGL